MIATELISARVSTATKDRFATLARHQELSESVLLRRLVDGALAAAAIPMESIIEPVRPVPASEKISVRLRPDDLLLLRERAAARQTPAGTYVALLVRSHLRNLSPLPTEELATLKRSIAELGAIGRNLNQIARALHFGEESAGPDPVQLQALAKMLGALREETKGLVRASVSSWEVGYEQTGH